MFFAPAVRTRACPVPRFDRSFERFVNDAFFSAAPRLQGRAGRQGLDLSLDVPGVAREELTITIEGPSFASRPRPKPSASSRPPTSCRRTSTPRPPAAKLENGVLTLTLGKKVPVSNVSQLSIN